MKIYDETKTQELNETEIDYEKGYFKPDKIKTMHHDAVPAKTIDEQIAELTAQGKTILTVKDKHYEIFAAYVGGGTYVFNEKEGRYCLKQNESIKEFDLPLFLTELPEKCGKDAKEIREIPAQEAYDDYEDIQVYIPYTEEQLKERADRKRHAELKAELAKVKEDIEQVEYGLVRNDYAEKKARAAEIINELRVLEGKEPREIRTEIL